MTDPETADRFVVRSSRKRLALLLLGSLVMVAGSLWLTGLLGPVEVPLPDAVRVVVAVVGLVFFGTAGCYFGYGLVVRRPAVVLTPDGLDDRASGSAAGLVPWSEITGTEVIAMGRQPMLAVHVSDPAAVLARQGRAARGLMRQNAKLTGSVVTLPLATVDVPQERLVEEVERFRTTYGG